MTDVVRQICRRWIELSGIGALAGLFLVIGLVDLQSRSKLNLLVLTLPLITVAFGQAAAINRYVPDPGMAFLWRLLTPLAAAFAYLLTSVGFSGFPARTSYGQLVTVYALSSTLFIAILGIVQRILLRAWLGRAPFWTLITMVGNAIAVLTVAALGWLIEAVGLTDLVGIDRNVLMVAAAAPLMFVLSLFQVVSLKNIALHTEPFQRLR